MRRTASLIARFLAVSAVLAAVCSCTGSSPLAGGASDTGNARVAGVALYPDSTPVPGALVRIRPANYIPGDSIGRYDVTADQQGAFALSVDFAGEALLEASDRGGSGGMHSFVVAPESGSVAVNPILRAVGGIAGRIPASAREKGARIALLGLERPVQRPDSSGAFSFAAIPAGSHRLRVAYGDTLLGADTLCHSIEPDSILSLAPDAFPAAQVRVWTSASGDYAASNPANWRPEGIPSESTHVRLSLAGIDSLHWDLATGCASWTQTRAFDGVVLFLTRFEGEPVRIGGDVYLDGGSWTHRHNDSLGVWRLWMRIEGDVTIGPAARIDVDRKGFGNSYGPGTPAALTNDGAAYGGQGGDGCWQLSDSVRSASLYGSASMPVDPGSGGDGGPGGGAVRIDIGGELRLDGEICADGASAREHDGGGSGGGIALAARSLAGGGVVRADGGHSDNCGAGGGGRVSVRLNGAQPLSAWRGVIAARGGEAAHSSNPQQRGRPGTIYFETSDAPGGSLLITTGSAEGPPW